MSEVSNADAYVTGMCIYLVAYLGLNSDTLAAIVTRNKTFFFVGVEIVR